MAITINFAGASLSKPGSYTRLSVGQAGVAVPAVGTVALIGEADAGVPFSQEKGLSAVSFGPDELSAIKEKFGSGPLVDAAAMAISPSQQISGGAQEILLLKTNQSTKASLDISQGGSVYGTITHKKAGVLGNTMKYKCDYNSSTGKANITLQRPADQKGKTQPAPDSVTIGNTTLLVVQCTSQAPGANAQLTITDTHFEIVASNGPASLSVALAEFSTLGALAARINGSGYTASVPATVPASTKVSRLDKVSGQSIISAYSIKQDAAEVRDFFARFSDEIEFAQAIKKGLPSSTEGFVYLTGGTRGATSNFDILDCFDALLKRRVNFIVPLFSRDADADRADDLTDAASNYTIDSVHAAASAHCDEASTVKGRKERQAWVGFKGSFDDSVQKAVALNSARVSMCIQDVDMTSQTTGGVEKFQPHMLAVASAAMHAAAPIGLSTTFKAVRISGFDHEDFEAETQAEKAIAANITFVERAPNGNARFVLDNNTYASEASAWIYNRPSVIYAGDFASYMIRLSTEQFVGQRNSDVSAESIKNLLGSLFDSLRSLGVIVPDANTGGKGYKDLTVGLNGSVVSVGVTLALVENIEFILSDIKVQRAG